MARTHVVCVDMGDGVLTQSGRANAGAGPAGLPVQFSHTALKRTHACNQMYLSITSMSR